MTEIPRAIRIDVRIVSFVRRFRSAYDRGPSLREIGLDVGSDEKTTISRAVKRLVTAGRLIRAQGGLDLPVSIDAAVSLLEQQGFKVIRPKPDVERNDNYSAPADMIQMLGKLD